MDTVTRIAQEGTFLSDSHTGVPVASVSVAEVPEGGHSPCACKTVTEILSRVGDKWSMQVVMSLAGGTLRFNELRRAIDGISQRMLTRTLRGLERDGLVERTVTPSVPPRVDYALTALGRSLRQPVAELGQWALQNREMIVTARERFDAEDDS
ncbi:transcriptional regulator [Croceicoccus estronivorus]|uniref:winged helix-turn-helix transcriptional regulator n=1 Tax=Croceicoccus estronivorus TaxID=1172626 RepID=UPI0008338542|nr:helix-turn-helix domain-containing protein [Croceicoccus estronivorus]OCC23036.1 transcriptional regulator [Croceicoccus estronivorus]